MCNNYVPVQAQLLRDVYRVTPPDADYPPETFPDYLAPVVRLDATGQRVATLANFGLVPKARIPAHVKDFGTTNARAETLGERRNYVGPWRACQFCLIPAASLYEPNYEAGPKSVRYRISPTDAPSFGIAGLWREWPDGLVSMTMITVNADAHPMMRRMHRPDKEKRSVVMLDAGQWDDWLHCRDPELARSFFRLYPAERMAAAPAPPAPRQRRAASAPE